MDIQYSVFEKNNSFLYSESEASIKGDQRNRPIEVNPVDTLRTLSPYQKLSSICIVTNISLLLSVLLDTLQLATGATGLFSQGATAVVHGCSVRALGHNLGEEISFIMATLWEGTQSSRKYTRLHSWTIYCKILSLHSANPPLRVGTSSHGYCQT